MCQLSNKGTILDMFQPRHSIKPLALPVDLCQHNPGCVELIENAVEAFHTIIDLFELRFAPQERRRLHELQEVNHNHVQMSDCMDDALDLRPDGFRRILAKRSTRTRSGFFCCVMKWDTPENCATIRAKIASDSDSVQK